MNLILIVSDTLRWDYLGFYGNRWVHTPNLDRFAAESLVFDKAYTGSFPTIPHRTDLLTGRYCFHTKGWSPLKREDDTVPKILQKNGYHTALVADTDHLFNTLFPGGTPEGFAEVNRIGGIYSELGIPSKLPEPLPDVKMPCSVKKLRVQKMAEKYPYLVARKEEEHFCAQTMQRATEWLEKNHGRHKFFLYVDTFDPHEPWVPPDEYVDLYDPGYEGEVIIHPRYDLSGYLSESEINHMRAIYAAMVTLVDKWTSRLLDKVKELGLMDETAIVFTSDHGFYHGEHGRVGKHGYIKDGWPIYEEVGHIPLVMKTPHLKSASRSDTLVQPADIAATLLDLTEVQVPADLHGRSMMPLLQGEAEQIRSIAVSSTGPCIVDTDTPRPPWYNMFRMSPDPEYVAYSTITDGRWSLIYANEGVPAELYDLRVDPRQERNVISQNQDIARGLHQEFHHFLHEIGTTEELLRIRKRI